MRPEIRVSSTFATPLRTRSANVAPATAPVPPPTSSAK